MRTEIEGVVVHDLTARRDDRGILVEAFREEWGLGATPLQWNTVFSLPGTLRGVHCHIDHSDIITIAQGALILGLVDIREDSPTHRMAELHRVPAFDSAVMIPPGVAHGFYFEEPTTMVYGVTHYWSEADELGCRWNDPQIGIDWPCTSPRLSQRDATAGSFSDMCRSAYAGFAPTGS